MSTGGSNDASEASPAGSAGGRGPLVPPPVLGLLIGVAMTGVARLTPALAVEFPLRRPLALLLVGAGVSIDAVSLLAFFRARTTISPLQPERASTLVVSGLYCFSRNPMYLGLLIVLCGWAVWLANPLNAVLVALFVALMNAWQIRPEERALRAKFGQSYEQYCQRVRRWL